MGGRRSFAHFQLRLSGSTGPTLYRLRIDYSARAKCPWPMRVSSGPFSARDMLSVAFQLRTFDSCFFWEARLHTLLAPVELRRLWLGDFVPYFAGISESSVHTRRAQHLSSV